jgi:hypothetical protein
MKPNLTHPMNIEWQDLFTYASAALAVPVAYVWKKATNAASRTELTDAVTRIEDVIAAHALADATAQRAIHDELRSLNRSIGRIEGAITPQ